MFNVLKDNLIRALGVKDLNQDRVMQNLFLLCEVLTVAMNGLLGAASLYVHLKKLLQFHIAQQ